MRMDYLIAQILIESPKRAALRTPFSAAFVNRPARLLISASFS